MYDCYGRKKYYTAILPDGKSAYSYSAVQMQEDLSKLFVGQRIMAIYVDLNGYLDAFHHHASANDPFYMGSRVLIVFDKAVLELAVHAEGMIEYRCFPAWELKLQEQYDYLPDDIVLSDRCFFDISDHEPAFDYKGRAVQSISVKGTDTWGFPQPGFDEEIAKEAAKKHDMPTEIVLHTEDRSIYFAGDGLECCLVILEREKV